MGRDLPTHAAGGTGRGRNNVGPNAHDPHQATSPWGTFRDSGFLPRGHPACVGKHYGDQGGPIAYDAGFGTNAGPKSEMASTYRVVKESSDSGVKLEQATESVATANGPGLRRYVRRRKEKKIAFALVVPFQVMMIDVLVQRPA